MNELASKDQLYEPEERFLDLFYQFAYRLNSLHRHWHVARWSIGEYLEALSTLESDGSQEMDDFRDERLYPDSDYFPDFVRSGVLSQALGLLERMLDDVALEVAVEVGAPLEFDPRPLPYIDRYILFLTRGCGLKLEISKQLWRDLNAVRELRNRYIHKIGQDLPNQIRAKLESMVGESGSQGAGIDDSFVEHGLATVAELGKAIEAAYWRWWEGRAMSP